MLIVIIFEEGVVLKAAVKRNSVALSIGGKWNRGEGRLGRGWSELLQRSFRLSSSYSCCLSWRSRRGGGKGFLNIRLLDVLVLTIITSVSPLYLHQCKERNTPRL